MKPWWSRQPKVRVIQQMEAAECGVACLAMILDHVGCSVPMSELRTTCGTSRDGNSAGDLLAGARQYGLAGRGLRASLQGLVKLRAPAILHWNSNHFVVYEGVRAGFVAIVDPASGRRRVPIEEASQRVSGAVLELWRSDSFQRRKAVALSRRRYRDALLRHGRALAFVLLATVAGQLLALASPAAQQILIDQVVLPARMPWLLPLLGIILFATLTSLALGRLQGVSQALLNVAVGTRLSRDMAEHMVSLPLTFLQSRSHGDLISRVQLNGSLQSLLASTAKASIDLVFVAALTCLMLAYNPMLGSISLGLTALRVVVLRLLSRPMADRAKAEIAAEARERSALVEAASLLEMTKGLGLEQRMSERYAERASERARWGIHSARLGLGIGSVMTVLGATMQALIFWVGGNQVVFGQMSLGVFTGFLTIRGLLEVPLGALVSLAESWIRVRGTLERCDDILAVAPSVAGSQIPARVEGRIELSNVGFRYGNGGKWVLRNVNLCISPGEHVALVGPSGQGKSTLAQLICGLLEPSEGSVSIDGIDVRQYERAALACQLGVVLQAPLIFEGSVLEAIRLRHPDADVLAVQDAARLACFEEVVERLPGRYQARLEPMGSNISGGERQRLALAQALLGRPSLLVLDEATCSLDAKLEQRVIANLSSVPATIVSVAHRQPVIANASRVFRVTAGNVAEVTRDRSGHPHLSLPAPRREMSASAAP
jgi:ATP-binding cassette subfamily B protein